MVVTQYKTSGMFLGVSGTKASSGQVSAALALVLVSLVLHWFRWFPLVISITFNSNHSLQQFKDTSIAMSTHGPFGPARRV